MQALTRAVSPLACLCAFAASLSAGVQVLTQHNDNNRTGANTSETQLNTSNVNVNAFGKLFSRAVDGQIYAQPLYVPNVRIPTQGTHNVVYIATEHNSVYAFDADIPAASPPLWQVSLGTSVLSSNFGIGGDLIPEFGITGTPAINAQTGTLYVVAETYENGAAVDRLHALDITTGAEKFGGPVVIQGSVLGTGTDSVGGTVTFNPMMHWQRPGLVLANGNVYIGYGSHQDTPPYHGWIFAYNATSMQRVAVHCVSPDDAKGGVWQGGVGIAADASGSLYIQSGQGKFDINTGGRDYGSSVVKYNATLTPVDYFAPSNAADLDVPDIDFGASGPILIPGTSLGVGGGKDGKIFLWNTGNLTHFNTPDQVLQEWQGTNSLLTTGDGGYFGGHVFYKNTLYTWGRRDTLKAFTFNGSTFNTTPTQGPFTVPDGYSNEPAISLSANGNAAGSAILWASYSNNGNADGHAVPANFHAFDAANVTHELWNSNQNQARDNAGSWAKWNSPMIANGRVYLPTFDGLFNVYGLLTHANGGSLAGSVDTSTAAENLSQEGGLDWIHWGDASVNRKAGVTAQLSTYNAGGTSVQTYSGDPRAVSWTGGTPTASSTNNTNGVSVTGVGHGFTFTAPADTSARTLTVHGGGVNSGGTLTAHLSDGSAPDFVDVASTTSGQYDRNYEITYTAATSGQTLTVSWSMSSGTGSVRLSAADLNAWSGNFNLSATGGTPQSTRVNTAFPTALQATVRDVNNNPVSGIPVTFTAPGSGPSGTFGGQLTASGITNSSGVATAPSYTANTIAGGYTVTATAPGQSTLAAFSLTNNPGTAVNVAASSGTPQSRSVNTGYGAMQALVTDSFGNAVSGVTVTFTAPGSGASGTFSGSASGTDVTDGGGLAIAPAFTANGSAGAYSVTGTVPGGTTHATFSLTNTAAGVSGSLSGAGNSNTTAVNLTSEGTSDWVHWGDASLNRKSGVAAQISNYTVIGINPVGNYTSDSRLMSWTDGTPTASSSNNSNGVSVSEVGNGFLITAPASSTLRTLNLHVGGFVSGGTLTAHLSDGSAVDFTDVTTPPVGSYDRNYTLTYKAASAGQNLTITWVMTSGGGGNVHLNAVALTGGSAGAPSITATAGTPQSATIGANFATALQATVKDASNNPMSGVTVTFTAPSSGASGKFGASLTGTGVTNGSGVANAPTFTANNTTGSYTVTATAPGVSATANFALANNTGSAASIAASAGTPQSTTVNTNFATALQATVQDAGGNAVAGVTVTFTAPSSGASGKFGASLTGTGVTNSSGVATAPTFTANTNAGSYTVAATAPGVATGANFSLSNTAAGSSGSLSGSSTSVTTAVNLTTEGTADWVHWGDASLNRKSGVAAQLSNYTAVGTSNVSQYGNDLRPMSWTDGTPTASSSANSNGLFIGVVGSYFSFTAPADTSTRTLIVHVGGYASSGKLTATLSDGSDAPFTDTTAVNGGQYDRNYTLVYSAGSSGQSLTVTWTLASGANVTLNGAALNGAAGGGAPSITASFGTPQSGPVGANFPIALQATVQDANNNPLSGVTVTFTAPSSGVGPSGTFGASITATGVTNSSGVVNSPIFTANGTVGSYTVTATAPGVSTPASFNLTNTGSTAANIAATGGTPQSTTINTNFAAALQATVKDGSNNPVSGVTVTFTAPSSGVSASGKFGASLTATAVTNGIGVATSPTFTANGTPGSYTVTATVAGVVTPANFSLTNSAGTAASITASFGTPQSATVGANFPAALQATVKDASNNPLSGVTVTFTAPSSGVGPSGTFAGSLTATGVTNSSGVANSPLFTANNTAGSYTVTATVSGVASPANFNLTNTGGTAASIAATGGTPQSTAVSTNFAAALQATVKDAGNNPVNGVTVTFTAPSSGASGKFGASLTATGTTNSSGVATAPTLTANATAGNYTVTATVSGVATPANFSLTNTGGAAGSITATFGTPQNVTVGTNFPAALQATVKDASNNPLSGVTVTFTAPTNGASGTFAASSTATGVTNSSGVVNSPTFTANNTAGTYTVTATAPGVATPATFNLTNNTGVAASIAATGGTPQSATVSTNFAATLQATVKDAGNNPISGVTVTFTAPSSGASGKFGASLTGTGVTNSSGVATSPPFTANATTGSYTVGATAPGVATGANFSLTNTAVASSGSLTGSFTSSTTAANLTTEGTSDWVHWGDASLNRKAGVAAQLSDYTAVGTSNVSQYGNDLRPLSWTDGSPTGSASNNLNGVFIGGTGSYFTFTAPADLNPRTLIVHVGGYASSGTLRAQLSDGSDSDFVDTTAFNGGQFDRNYTLVYNAASGGQTLTVTWTLVSGANVTLNGAALSGAVSATPSITATFGTPQSAAVGAMFPIALQATVTDAGNNPMSGVTVTFTAPSNGASGKFGASSTATGVTNSSGVVNSPLFTANATVGSYTVTATAPGASAPASFNLTNTTGTAASIAATGGTPQSATVSTDFAAALQATVKDSGNNPLSGVTVTFTAPSSGASGKFGASLTGTGVTNGSGVATSPTFTANSTTGSYAVVATVPGVGTGANHSLTNTAGPAAVIAATAGTPQNATVSTNFAATLQATVKDAGGNPVSGVTVTFTAPSSGASGKFGASLTGTGVTNSSGVAISPTFTANATAGSYAVVATASGVAAGANFNLTNTAASSGGLAGSFTTVSTAVNLTAEGVTDWVHWGDASLNRKAGVTARLSDYTAVGTSNIAQYGNDPRSLSWTDGTPTASDPNNTNGLFTGAVGSSFTFTAPADTTQRTLIIHVGGWASSGKLTAHLSDGSDADFTDTTAPTGNQFDRNYTLVYSAGSPGKTLTITWTLVSGANVTLNGAALQ